MSYCPNCSQLVDASAPGCEKCGALFSSGGWFPLSAPIATDHAGLRPGFSIMKVGASFLALLLIAVISGLVLQSIVPGCYCVLSSGCSGCGGVIGNALSSFSLICFALGAMGFVLLLWFGIPLAVLGGVVYGIYSFFRKRENLLQRPSADE